MLTTKEAGNKLFVCAGAVRNYIRLGKLKAQKVKKGMRTEYRIKNDDLEEFKKKYLI